MAIYRGAGGAVDVNSDITYNEIITQVNIALDAANRAYGYAEDAYNQAGIANGSALTASEAATAAAASAGYAAGSEDGASFYSDEANGYMQLAFGYAAAAELAAQDAAAYAASINPSDLVHISGAETVTGTKTFSADPILSSGTANGLVYMNGSKAITSGSFLTWDGSTFNVLGSAKAGVFVGSNEAVALYDTPSIGSLEASKPLYISTTSGSNADLVFQRNGAEQMRIGSAGVGIGTSNPLSLLSVRSSTGPVLTLENSSSALTTNTVIGKVDFYTNDATTNATGVAGSIGTYSEDIYGLKTYISFATRHASSPATERLRITSSGNLGLGVTPSAWDGSYYSAFQFGNQGASLSAWKTSLTSSKNVYLSNNLYQTYAIDVGPINRYVSDGPSSAYRLVDGAHQWHTAPSGTAGAVISFTQAMTLDSSGRLGIGTSSPTHPLNIVSSIAADVTTLVKNQNTGYCSSYVAVDDTGTKYATIGVLNSTTTLQSTTYGVAGDAFIRASTSANGLVLNSANSSGYIRFQIGGSSGAEKARIDSSGRLGIGTSSPSYPLDVNGLIATRDAYIITANSSGVPSAGAFIYRPASNTIAFGTNVTERARIDSSGNFAVACSATTVNSSTASGMWYQADSYLVVARDGGVPIYSNRIGTDGVVLGLRIDGAQKASLGIDGSDFVFNTGAADTERARIDSSGNFLVGTTSTPNASNSGFSINNSGTSFDISSTGSTFGNFIHRNYTTGNRYSAAFYLGTTLVGSIGHSGSSTSYNTSSDYRLKEDWVAVADASARVNALKPVNFAWKADGKRVDGFLAHELAEVVPEAVTGEKDAVDADGAPVYQGIDQSKLVPLLTAALQEALAEIDSLKTRLNAAGL